MGLLETVPIQLSSMNVAPDAIELNRHGLKHARTKKSVHVCAFKTQDHPPWLRTSSGKLSKPQSEGDDWVWTWKQVNAPESSAVSVSCSQILRFQATSGHGVLPPHCTKYDPQWPPAFHAHWLKGGPLRWGR